MYTKGEWEVHKTGRGFFVSCQSVVNGSLCEADAKLISASPDLYEACKQASLYHSVLLVRTSEDKKIKDGIGVGWGDICDMIEQALAKAEGGKL